MNNSNSNQKIELISSGGIAIDELINRPSLNPNPITYSQIILRPNARRIAGVSYAQVLMNNSPKNER